MSAAKHYYGRSRTWPSLYHYVYIHYISHNFNTISYKTFNQKFPKLSG